MDILLVEDDDDFRETLSSVLERKDYNVVCAADGLEAWEKLQKKQFDIVLADWNMPNFTGLDLCKMARDHGKNLPFLMITARDMIGDKVTALEAGADDYLVKPFSNKELVARINALVRRAGGTDKVIQYDGLVLHQNSHKATLDGEPIRFGPIEWQLLWTLAEQAEKVCSHEFLYQKVWGYDFSALSKTLEVHIGYLRKQLEKNNRKRLIHTVRGFGYVLRDHE